ncbi:hypothetical protein GCM10027425_19750 [Alteromonas gracilis]
MTEQWVAGIALGLTAAGLGVLVHRLTHAAAAGRLARNHLVGLRIARTLADDASWASGHLAALTWTRRTAVGVGALGLLTVPAALTAPGRGLVLGGVAILALLLGLALAVRDAHRALG